MFYIWAGATDTGHKWHKHSDKKTLQALVVMATFVMYTHHTAKYSGRTDPTTHFKHWLLRECALLVMATLATYVQTPRCKCTTRVSRTAPTRNNTICGFGTWLVEHFWVSATTICLKGRVGS